MTVVLLDQRWPTMIPLEVARLSGPVTFTDEVPISVRWNFADMLQGNDGGGVLVSTDPSHPEVLEALGAGHALVESPSLTDSVHVARQVMTRALAVGQWESQQTHKSLLPYLEEESAEFADAVRQGAGDNELRKELGDVLLQVLFHAEIAARRGAFDFDDVADSFVAKLKSRSPYLFDGTTTQVPVEEQERLWAQGKAAEHADDN